MNAQIEGRVAVVTGGSSGIGFETLRLLLGEGAKVAFCGRNPDRLASAHAALQNEYPGAEVFLPLRRPERRRGAGLCRCGSGPFWRRGHVDQQRRAGLRGAFADTPREAWLHEAELKLFGVINPVKPFRRSWSARISPRLPA